MGIESIYQKIFSPYDDEEAFLNHPIVKEISRGWEPEESEESDLLKIVKLEPKFKKIFFDKKLQLSAVQDTLNNIAYYNPDNPIFDLLSDAARLTKQRFKGKKLDKCIDVISSDAELSRLAEKLYKQINKTLSYNDGYVYDVLQEYIDINHVSPEAFLAIALGAKSDYSKFLFADSIEDWSSKALKPIVDAALADQYAVLVYNMLFVGRDSITEYIKDDLYDIGYY